MKRQGVPVLRVVALVVAAYGGYRIVPHLNHGRSGAVDGAVCVGGVTHLRVLAHPVIAFGDSITLGYDASRRCQAIQTRAAVPVTDHIPHAGDTTYPADLSRLAGLAVPDYGVSGETTSAGSRRLPRVLAAVHPRAVVLLGGVNDLRAGRGKRLMYGHAVSKGETGD